MKTTAATRQRTGTSNTEQNSWKLTEAALLSLRFVNLFQVVITRICFQDEVEAPSCEDFVLGGAGGGSSSVYTTCREWCDSDRCNDQGTAQNSNF